jgi:hypothetical protein
MAAFLSLAFAKDKDLQFSRFRQGCEARQLCQNRAALAGTKHQLQQ